MACAILYLSRHISKLDPWPKIFNNIYNINPKDFTEEYNYVNNFCENNILISHLNNKKRQRNNSTCKNINMKRISFNSTFNNNNNSNNNNNKEKFLIHNGNNSNKVANDNNNLINNEIKRNNSKYINCYYHEKNNICDTNSNINIINYFTNKDSSKKNNSNNSLNKMSSKTKAKSNENNSQESYKKDKLLNSSAKYIRTQHRLIKNNHQFAFNQSMEMPRKTYIFQNRIYHSRTKKIDNDNKINSNRSQHQYNITKNLNHPLNDNIDNIRDDNNRGNKYLEKKNRYRKILNNSEIQINKKNNSQSSLLFFNIKKSSSVKLIVENSKKNNLSNYSNGKNEKDKHQHLNNNSSTHKNKKNENNINYSNTKNRYIYYKHNLNNNFSVKKKNDKYEISKEHKDISANLSFITITDTYNLNSQKKKDKRNNIKLIDSAIKKNIMNNQKDIDNYQNKNNNMGKNRLSHIKYNSCINAKITNINLYDEKSLGVKKETNTSHKAKHPSEKENGNNNIQNYYTNIIFNKQKKNEKYEDYIENNKGVSNNNKNIIIKINLMSRKLDSINRNRLFQRHVKKSNEGIIKKIKLNNYNIIKRKETSKRKTIDNNVSSYCYKNNNSNNNSSLVIQNDKSNDKNEKNNSDGYKHKNNGNYNNNNHRYNMGKRGRNYSMVNQKKLKNSNSLL